MINSQVLTMILIDGTATGMVANKLNRKYIGIEKEREYLDLTIKRKKSDYNE